MRLFEHIPLVHPVYKGHRETLDLLARDGTPLRIHAVPQCASNEDLAEQVASIPAPPETVLPDAANPRGHDVLMVHGGVQSLKSFAHAEFNELTLDASWFDARFSYVALGHYHGLQQVNERAWYCGAPERISMAEAGQQKGYLEVRLASGPAARQAKAPVAHQEGPRQGRQERWPEGRNESVPQQVVFHPLPGRPYSDLVPLDASGLAADEILAKARAAVALVPEGAVARLRITGLAASLRGVLDLSSVREAGRHTLHLDLTKLEWASDAPVVPGDSAFGSLADEFDAFARRVPMVGLERERLVAMAREILTAAGSPP